MLIVNIYMDYVIVEGICINRPSRIPRSLWERIWQRLMHK